MLNRLPSILGKDTTSSGDQAIKSPTPPEAVVKEGYLTKWPGRNKVGNPKKRYFVLEADCLRYYESRDAYVEGKDALKVLPMAKEITIIKPEAGSGGKGFQLVLDGHELKLQGEVSRDDEDWMEKMRGRRLLLKADGERIATPAGEEAVGAGRRRPLFVPRGEGEEPHMVGILGAGGPVGMATAKAVMAKLVGPAAINAKLRCITRNPDNLQGELESCVEDDITSAATIVHGDMGRPESLHDALLGVEYLFIVSPGAEDWVRLATNGITAAKEAGVQFILLISSTTVGLPTTLFGRHFDTLEAALKKADLPYSTLRCPLFMENLMSHRGSVNSHNCFYFPLNQAKHFSTIAVDDIALAAATILTTPAPHVMKTYHIAAPAITVQDLAATFTKVLERPIHAETVTYEQARSSLLSMGFWEWAVDGMLEIYRLADVDSPCAFVRHSDFEALAGRPATTVESWLSARRLYFQPALDSSGSVVVTLPNYDPPPTPVYDPTRAVSPLSEMSSSLHNGDDAAVSATQQPPSHHNNKSSNIRQGDSAKSAGADGTAPPTSSKGGGATSQEQRAKAIKATRACCVMS